MLFAAHWILHTANAHCTLYTEHWTLSITHCSSAAQVLCTTCWVLYTVYRYGTCLYRHCTNSKCTVLHSAGIPQYSYGTPQPCTVSHCLGTIHNHTGAVEHILSTIYNTEGVPKYRYYTQLYRYWSLHPGIVHYNLGAVHNCAGIVHQCTGMVHYFTVPVK